MSNWVPILLLSSFFFVFAGANLFLRYAFDSAIHIINDTSFGKEFDLGENENNHIKGFDRNRRISINEIRMYTFQREKPFTKLENTFFEWKNYTFYSQIKYTLKVSVITYGFHHLESLR